MNRITPDMVVDAYKTSKLIPVYGEWGTYTANHEDACGCAITALGACKVGFDTIMQNIITEDGCANFNYLSNLLGYDQEYLSGFIYGFDVCPVNDENAKFMAGVEDGHSARQAVIAEIGMKEHAFPYDID